MSSICLVHIVPAIIICSLLSSANVSLIFVKLSSPFLNSVISCGNILSTSSTLSSTKYLNRSGLITCLH
uniref:Uncharacterized protein n=1 Tax=Panstrongylus lignarius TaxID=156445 RepID=A0A224Y586_9HEMI